MPFFPHRLLRRIWWQPAAQDVGARGLKLPVASQDESSGLQPIPASTAVWLGLAFLGLGLALRLARYLLDFPLWGDETMLAVNFLDRGYLDLALPLDNLQISPLLFSWIELSATKIFGFSASSLRLFPVLCGLASLSAFWWLARRFCSGAALVVAVAVFSVSYYLIRHATEIKPYSSDLCASLLYLVLAVKVASSWRAKWWALLGVLTPALVMLSYPIVFVAGGVSLFLLAAAEDRTSKSFWLPWGLFNLALVGTFLGNYWLIASAHYVRTYTQGVGAMWIEGWPPISRPGELIVWAIREHTGRMFAYPIGGKNGGSAVTFVLFLLGVWRMWSWRDHRTYLVLLLSPFFLGFLAAAMQKYPYGGSARTMLYLAPSICLLAGIGGGWLLERITCSMRKKRMLVTAFGVLTVLGGINFARDLIRPYKTIEDQRLEAFAQWLWTDYGQDCELVCAGTDLGYSPYGKNWNEAAHDYRCWQRSYSARHRARQAPDWDSVSPERPLKLVMYHVTQAEVDLARLQSMLDELGRDYDLVGRETLPVNPHADSVYARQYDIYTFTPKSR
ncbi:MAG: glycosyltransferase family 39 protein [Pirellulales bacterium]|nr:glycosyltransferase family 39 protein [Pirellulales bacterium]